MKISFTTLLQVEIFLLVNAWWDVRWDHQVYHFWPAIFLAFSLPETNKLISANGKLMTKWHRKKNKYYFCNPLRANWGKKPTKSTKQDEFGSTFGSNIKWRGRHFSHIEISRDINKQPLKLLAPQSKYCRIRNLWWRREASCPTLYVQGLIVESYGQVDGMVWWAHHYYN